MAENPRK